MVNRSATGWGSYSPDGSVEERDAAWIAEQGADYLKCAAALPLLLSLIVCIYLRLALSASCFCLPPSLPPSFSLSPLPPRKRRRFGPCLRCLLRRVWGRYDAVCGGDFGAPPLNTSFGVLDWEQVVVRKMGMALNRTGRPIWYQVRFHVCAPPNAFVLVLHRSASRRPTYTP